MAIKQCKFLLIILFFVYSKSSDASEKIIVERYEQWTHPILKVFKRYGIIPYLISYSSDGTCPTFYAKFKYSPDPRAPNAAAFHQVYFEALAANSFFPYSLVDKEDDLRINVGWRDKKKTTMIVDLDKFDSISTCKIGE